MLIRIHSYSFIHSLTQSLCLSVYLSIYPQAPRILDLLLQVLGLQVHTATLGATKNSFVFFKYSSFLPPKVLFLYMTLAILEHPM